MIPASAKLLFARLSSTPQRRLATLSVLAAVVGITLVTALWLGPRWTFYSLEGTGLEVELPAAPVASRAGTDGKAGALFQVRSAAMAVVANGAPLPAGAKPDAGSLVQQAMAQVRSTPGIADLDYRVGQEYINGQACLVVAGTFRREGVPSRLQGAFFLLPTHHGHLLCFWSDKKGALQARRVLQSVRVEASR
jgi:hypothetical protein